MDHRKITADLLLINPSFKCDVKILDYLSDTRFTLYTTLEKRSSGEAFSTVTYVVGTCWNRLTEAIPTTY